MNSMLTAAVLFSLLLSHARSPSGVDGDRRVSKGELQYAFAALEFDNEGVSKQEANTVREVLFKNRRLLMPDAQVAGDQWLAQYSGANSNGATPVRRAEIFRRTASWFSVMRGSSGLTAYDTRFLLSLLGTRVSPARVVEVREWAAAYTLVPEAKTIVESWLKRNSLPQLPADFSGAVTPVIQGLLWMSESDRPIYGVSLGKTQVWPLSKAQTRQLLGESHSEAIDQFAMKQIFAWVDAALNGTDALEKSRAQRFSTLRTVLEQQLTQIRVFKVGNIDRDLLILGKTKDGVVCGIMTQVIES